MSKKSEKQIPAKNEFKFPEPLEKKSFTQIMYDSRDGSFFGRTPFNWCKLLIFYTIFYAALTGLLIASFHGLMSTLNDIEPKWKLNESIIGINPGVSYRPQQINTELSPIIHYDLNKIDEVSYWIELLDHFFEPYVNSQNKNCTYEDVHNLEKVCKVDINNFGPCNAGGDYGYTIGKPCIFLKLNRIYNWLPEFYDQINDLPEGMPDDLKSYISRLPINERKQIWFSCDGHNAKDKEAIGERNYYPGHGLPTYFYPYINQNGYLSPLIAVQFSNLTKHQLINIECRVWAKNIEYNRHKNNGVINIELLID